MQILGRCTSLILLITLMLGTTMPAAWANEHTPPDNINIPPITIKKVADPDRDGATPTSWHWWKNRTSVELEAMRLAGERIIDLEPSPDSTSNFDAVLVSNQGPYKRVDGWWSNFNKAAVDAKVAEKNGRITDLEPYTVNGERRFAFALIRNEGVAEKQWWWDYDVTPAQIAEVIDQQGMRLIDLDVYEVNGKTHYAYVGIANKGVDGRAWWWYVNVDMNYVVDRLAEHKARLIDIEVHSNGNLSVVMVENDGTAWWWGVGATQEWISEVVTMTGSRLVDLESYLVNGKRRYAMISIDNANAETRRLRNLIFQAYDAPAFGAQQIRGFIVQEIGGETFADLAGGWRFQPLSTLKVVPYLYALIQLDANKQNLTQVQVSWTESTVDDPATSIDERIDQSCLKQGAQNTQAGSATLADALPTMMWESHNRTLDAVMGHYGTDNIRNYMQNVLGLTNTEMYPGCPQPNGPQQPWAANRTTLRDLAALYAGVDTLQFMSATGRQAFQNNMINLNYKGASYTSPITGRMVGSLTNGSLRALVKREAGPDKQALVESFLQHVVIRGKGGGGGPSGNEFGYSDFLYVTLPFKEEGTVVHRTFVAGWFVYGLATPPGCPESTYKESESCIAIWQPEQEALATFRSELLAAPIRKALETWEVSSNPPSAPPAPDNQLYLPVVHS
jgi:hypothetical protein